MLLLTAVNEILPKLGERPVTSTATKHPTLSVIIPEIDAKRRDLLTKGWWFNRFKTTLYPDLYKHIALPVDTLAFHSTELRAVQRGTELYNGDTQSYEWSEAVDGYVIQNVAFELLPDSAAQVVLYTAVVSCYATDIGMEQVVQLWMQSKAEAMQRMESEHLRNMRYTTRRSPRHQNLQCALRG